MKLSKRLSTRKVVLLSIIAILVIGLAIIATLPSVSRSQDLSALLSEMVGVVEVRNGGQDQYNQVNNGFLLKAIMQLQTKEESRVRLDLSTKSIVRLGQSTIFSLDPQGPVTGGVLTQIELQAGRVWVILRGGSLDVNTPAGLAAVRGSYMSVWVEPKTNRITVCCLEGKCGYKNAAGNVEMTSGQKIISSDTNIVPRIEKMDQTDVQSWLDNSPEAAVMVPQISSLLASPTSLPSSTPSLTPTFTIETATTTPTATPAPGLSNPAGSGTLTPTPTPSLTPPAYVTVGATFTPSATQIARSTRTPIPAVTRTLPPPASTPIPTKPAPPPPTSTKPAPPPPPTIPPYP